MIVADTHTVLWLTQEHGELSPAADAALVAARTDGGIAISGMTLWEITMLATRKRISIDRPMDVYLRHLESVFVVLPLNGRIAERAMQFTARYPRDPTDRIIGATALVHGLQLVTRDDGIRASGEVPVVW
jgi:PIN domain nuclease of toxin-antitoxin system